MNLSSNQVLADIAKGAEITGIAWRSQASFYAMLADLTGLRVLDICAGMSDCTLRLTEHGALAVALDVCYADLEDMLTRNHKGFEATARNVFGVNADSDRGRELYRSFTEGFVTGLETCPHVAATATALPFPDASFDVVISFNGIFGTLDFDAGVLRAALNEALRVVKAGGSVQLLPYQQGQILNDHERANQHAAATALRQLPGLQLEETIARSEAGIGGVGRLTIRKTATVS